MTDHITLPRALVEQALDVLENYATHRPFFGSCPVRDVEYALRDALNKPKKKRRTVKKRLTDDGWKGLGSIAHD